MSDALQENGGGAKSPEAQLVGPLLCKIVTLAAGLAGAMALAFSRLGGCDWMGSLWRGAVAMTVVAFVGGLLAGPLQQSITPVAKPVEGEGKAPEPPAKPV